MQLRSTWPGGWPSVISSACERPDSTSDKRSSVSGVTWRSVVGPGTKPRGVIEPVTLTEELDAPRAAGLGAVNGSIGVTQQRVRVRAAKRDPDACRQAVLDAVNRH